jgi:hypothetical protein
MADPPRASPRPPAPPLEEPLTDPSLHAALARHDNKLTWRSIFIAVGAVASGVVLGIIFIDNRVQAQTDAGVRVVQAEQKAIEARVQTLEKRFDRFDQKMDLMLDAQRVPDWKRPPPLDGGTK